MQLLRILVFDFAKGCGDSLKGFPMVWRLDSGMKELEVEPRNPGTSGDLAEERIPRTTLAQRRERERRAAKKSTERDSAPQSKLDKRPRATWRVLCCICVNVACILTLGLMSWILEMGSEQLGPRMAAALGLVELLFRSLGLVPFFLITRLVNCLWFSDIANAALRQSGRSSSSGSISHEFADVVFAVLLEAVFLLQSFLVRFVLPVPLVGSLLSYVHLALLYSLYCFEYLWMGSNLKLSQRLSRIESNWPYFLGFGCLLTLLTVYPSSYIVGGCVFGAFFPFFIVSSFHAAPVVHASPASVPVFRVFEPSRRLSNWVTVCLFTRLYPIQTTSVPRTKLQTRPR